MVTAKNHCLPQKFGLERYILKDRVKIIEYINKKIETNVFDVKQSYYYHSNKKFDLIKDVVALRIHPLLMINILYLTLTIKLLNWQYGHEFSA